MGTRRERRRSPAPMAALIALTAATLTTIPAAQVELGPAGSAYYYYSLAQQDRFQRNYLDAVNNLKSAVSYDPESVSLRLELARLYWLLGNRVNGFERNAVSEGEKAVALDPDNLEAHRFIASVHTTLASRGEGNSESLERAVVHHERALTLAEEGDRNSERFQLGKLYLQDSRFGNAVTVLEDYIAEDRESAEVLFWLSRAYVGQGRLGAARRPLKRAIQLSPKSFNLAEAMLELEQRRGDVPGAIAAANHLLSLAPESLVGHSRLARLYRLDGRPEEAANLYATAERLAESAADARARAAMPDLRYGRVESLREAGMLTEASDLASVAANRYQGDPRFAIARGELRYLQGDHRGGVRALDAVLNDATDPEARVPERVSRVYLRLGASAEQENDFDRSVELLESAIDVDPQNHVALNYLGFMWAERGINLDLSIDYIQQALELGGENGAYLDSLGWAYYQQERYDLAEESLVRAAKMSHDAEILDHLGDLYEATGRAELAVDAWLRALEARPPDASRIQDKIEGKKRSKIGSTEGTEELPR